jgi:putative ABC transport system permease protein
MAAPADQPARMQQATIPEYLAWHEQARSFDAMGTEQQLTRDVGADGDAPAETLAVQNLTVSMFRVLGIQPALGRIFTKEEEAVDSQAPVVLISDGLWQRRFARDPSIVGRTIRLDGVPTTIVGVMPAGFTFRDARFVDLWGPRAFTHAQREGSARVAFVAAKLAPGVTIAQAQAEMDSITARIAATLPPQSAGWIVRVEPLHDALYGTPDATLWLVHGLVAFVLLIGCANVAGLLLARGTSRSTEVAVRVAVGASRPRLIRQFLTESLVLALAGGAAGIGLAWALVRALIASGPARIPQLQSLGIDARVLAFTTGASLVTGVVFGLAPAIMASQTNLADALRTAIRGTTGPARHRLRSGLVVVQTALAVTLLVGAALLIRSLLRLQTSDLGATTRDVVTVDLQFSQAAFQRTVGSYRNSSLLEINPRAGATFEALWHRLQDLPGVVSASAVNHAPFSGTARGFTFSIAGRAPTAPSATSSAPRGIVEIVMPRYFETMGIPLIRGRSFDDRDSEGAPWAVVINEAMAKQYWPNQDPLGQQLTIGLVADDRPREVVGIVRNHKTSPYDRDPQPAMFTLRRQQPAHIIAPYGGELRVMTFVVKSLPGRSTDVIGEVRQAMRELNPDKALTNIRPLDDIVAKALEGTHYFTLLLSVFAGAAMFLTAIGIYGLLSHTVSERTREIGVRLALGGSHMAVVRPIFARALALVGAGVAVGVGCALVLGPLVGGLLWDITPADVPAYLGAGIVALVSGGVAALVPLSRAIRVAPTIALRGD